MNSYTEEMKGRTNMLTLDKFEEASEKVKEVTLETKLIYSDFLSDQTGNKVYLSLKICSLPELTRSEVRTTR